MDNRTRLNEICIIGQPRCGYAFSSTRSCFIGYGFRTSKLEVDILTSILEDFDVEPIQAGDRLAPAQNVFCTKICSKILTSQFCAVFLNNDETENGEVPNANVHQEYGMMLAFNKHVIPFQLESQTLAFNVAGLDTVKYSKVNFREKAKQAVAEAIQVTVPEQGPPPIDVLLGTFFLSHGVLMAPLDNEGEKLFYSRGQLLNYYLLHDLSGWSYLYFGVFTQLTPSAIIWRLERTKEILDGMLTSVDFKVRAGLANDEQQTIAKEAIRRFSIWLVVSDETAKREVESWHCNSSYPYSIRVFMDSEIRDRFEKISSGVEFESRQP